MRPDEVFKHSFRDRLDPGDPEEDLVNLLTTIENQIEELRVSGVPEEDLQSFKDDADRIRDELEDVLMQSEAA